MFHASHCRRGFGYLDLLVTLLAVMMLGALAVERAAALRDEADRTRCARNLVQIWQGLQLYIGDAKIYPRTKHDPDDHDLRYYTTTDKGTAVNDVTGAMFLLIRQCDVQREVFLCPARQRLKQAARSPDEPAPPRAAWDIAKMYNFPGPDNLDYAISNPNAPRASILAGYRWHPDQPAAMALAGDMGSGDEAVVRLAITSPAEEVTKANSPGHGGAGQNVLFNDGHVEWAKTPFCGALRDNVYTRAKTRMENGVPRPLNPPESEHGVAPAWAMDTVLVPTTRHGPTTTRLAGGHRGNAIR